MKRKLALPARNPRGTRARLPFAPMCVLALLVASSATAMAAEDDAGWIPLFDGKTLDGWKAAENPGSFRVEDGSIVCDGPRAHLFYAGGVENAQFKNFELRVSFKTEPGANSGVFFHTAWQETGFPKQGYEAQISNTYVGEGSYRERKKTGSLYGVRNQYLSIADDGQWCEMRVAVTGKRVRIQVNDALLVDFTEPEGWEALSPRRLSSGTFALQCHDPRSKVFFREMAVRPLGDEVSVAPLDASVVDDHYRRILRLQRGNFPLVDFHAHLKGGLTIAQLLEQSRRTGINYGVAPNCGVGFPITDDEGIAEFLDGMRGEPVFLGMQAEGREWVTMFSPEAVAKFDYVFTDAMTFTDDRGRRVRLWIREEIDVPDKQAFMEMYVDRIVKVIRDEPIDIYANATFLPAVLAAEYDALWTEARMDRVIAAAVERGVAIEINARYRIPSPAFIKRAKKAGATFSFGTNNSEADLGRLEYCLEMIDECGLTADDMFMPKER
jgi:hypothetical protein